MEYILEARPDERMTDKELEAFSPRKECYEELYKKENRDPLLLLHFSCHHLRHTFCTRLCENESNIKVIQ